MLFLLAVITTICWATQGTLMASVYRQMDPLVAITYRALSLGITMLPLLFFVPATEFASFHEQVPTIFAAASLSVIGNVANASTFIYLPVGIASALCMVCSAIVATGIGAIFFEEFLSPNELLCIAALLVLVVALAASKSKGNLPREYNPTKGLLAAVVFGLAIGSAFTLVALASRESHPLLTAYCWEFGIGPLGFLVALFKKKTEEIKIPLSLFKKILIFSSPTAIGSACYAMALTLGPIGIAAAIVSTVSIVSSLIARFLYKEKLTLLQWILILLACSSVGALKLANNEPSTLDEVSKIIEAQFPNTPSITPAELKRLLDTNTEELPILLDIRTKEEFAISHLPGAIRIDPNVTTAPVLNNVRQDRKIVLYCAVGYRSARVAKLFQDSGYNNVHNLRGSIFAWHNAGYPLYRGEEIVSEVHPYDEYWEKFLSKR